MLDDTTMAGPALAVPALAVPVDGQGCCRDNVLVERLWRSIKYEEV